MDGPSRRPGQAGPLDPNSAIRDFGVTVETVTAVLRQRTNRLLESGRSTYLQEPDENAGHLKLCFKIPKGHGFRTIDSENRDIKKKLDDIRTTCKVWIKTPQGRGADHLTIFAENTTQLRDSFGAIYRMVKLDDPDAEEKETMGMITYLVYPLHGENSFVASLKDTSDGKPRLEAALPRDAKLNPETRSQQASRFTEEFDKIAAILRRTPDKMQMRIHLGKLTLTQRPKTQEFRVKEIENLLRGVRRRKNTDFVASIGDGDYAKSVLDLICGSTEMFEATDTTTLALDEIIPKYTLIIISKGCHLETEVVPDDKVYNYTPGRVYHLGQRNQRAGINSFCPEQKLDWHLNIMTESDVKNVPWPLIYLLRDIRLKKSELDTLFPNFPRPEFKKHLAVDSEASEIIGKLTWQFGVTGTPYAIEVSIHHRWDPLNMDAGVVKSCGLCLVGLRWDQEMQNTSTAVRERDWGENFDRLFLEYEDRTGVESLLELVDMIRELVAQAPKIPDLL